MLKEAFLGRIPTHFNLNPLVKTFLLSESIMWSAYNLFFPIIAIFVINRVEGGGIELAAFGYSVYMITRIMIEIIVGQFLIGRSERMKIFLIILGLLSLSVSYLFFSITETVILFYLSYIVCGIGLGISAPARLSIFSKHLDKDKEAQEWSLHDATSYIGMATAGALGGLIGRVYGFSVLFVIAATINLFAIIPYLPFLRKEETFADTIKKFFR